MNQYQIEYRLNGVSNIFELYLFVNPLGVSCYQSEIEILKLLDLIAADIDLHILPIHNQSLVEQYMLRHQINPNDLTLRNQIFQAIYQASLAYKAACIQGRRLGRHFLMRMQEEFEGDIMNYDRDRMVDFAKDVGLDIETFISDFHSDFVRQLFFKDQNTAIELKVDYSPSLVIFEYLTGDGRLIQSRPIILDQVLEEIDHMVAEGIENYEQENTTGWHLRALK